MAEQNAEDLSSSDGGLVGENLPDNGRRISVSHRICPENENEFHSCDDLVDMPELESVSPSSDQDSVPDLESDSGNSEVQWGNPLNIELQGRWIQASVAVEEESDWLGSLSSDSAETQYPSDDGVSMGVEGDSARAYIDDLAMVINRNDVNYEDDSANAQIPQIPQDDQGNGSDSVGVERGGGTREAVFSGESLQNQMQIEIGMVLLNDGIRYEQESVGDRIQIEFNDDLVDENSDGSSDGPALTSSFKRL